MYNSLSDHENQESLHSHRQSSRNEDSPLISNRFSRYTSPGFNSAFYTFLSVTTIGIFLILNNVRSNMMSSNIQLDSQESLQLADIENPLNLNLRSQSSSTSDIEQVTASEYLSEKPPSREKPNHIWRPIPAPPAAQTLDSIPQILESKLKHRRSDVNPKKFIKHREIDDSQNTITPLQAYSTRQKEETVSNYVIYNANVHTSDSNLPKTNAFAVAAGRFLAVGDETDIFAQYPSFYRINAHGRVVIPGLIDSHAHLIALGSAEAGLDLTGCMTLEECMKKCLDYVKLHQLSSGAWVQGGGWDESLWPKHKFPTRYDLDKYFPDRPVVLERVDGHSLWCNSKAIEIAEKANGPFPEVVTGGRIERFPDTHEPTGIFSDSASDLIYAVVPGGDENDPGVTSKQAMRLAIASAKKNGLTMVHDASFPASSVELAQSMIDDDDFDIRVYAMVGSWDAKTQELFCPYEKKTHGHYGEGWGLPKRGQLFEYGHGKLTVRAAKVFMDGALGSRGAALLAPYSDDNSTSGSLEHTYEELVQIVRHWVGCGFQVNTHAIGDRASRLVLDAYEEVLKHEPDPSFRRLRVEHAQILTAEDIPRFAKLGVIPSMQPTHATSDMTFAEDRLGKERVKYGYAWRSLLDTSKKVVIAFGSDFPFAGFVNPFWGIHAAVTRQNARGQPHGGWYPEQKLTRKEALKGFTIDGAYAAFLEHELGSITPGKYADFVIVQGPHDIFDDKVDADPMLIRNASVLATSLGGKFVYCNSFDEEVNHEKIEKADLHVRDALPGCIKY